jgi:hypothetical protein
MRTLIANASKFVFCSLLTTPALSRWLWQASPFLGLAGLQTFQSPKAIIMTAEPSLVGIKQ